MSPNSVAIIGSCIILVLAHLLPWARKGSATLIRNPAKLAAVLSGLQVIPHFVIVSIWPEESMIFPAYGNAVRELLPRFGLFYACGFVALLLGIRWGARANQKYQPINISYQPSYYLISALMFALYLGAMALMVSSAGGIQVFIQNFGTQNEFQSNTGLFHIIKTPAAYLSILFLAVHHARTGQPKMIWIILYIMLLVLIESGLGGRRGPIQIVLFAMAAIYMVNPQKRLISATNIAMISVCVVVFVVLLNIRDDASGYTNSRGVISYLVNFSYNDIYIFIMDRFSKYELWYGKVFLDFQYRFTGGLQHMPAPSLDEGLYIYNLYLGYAVEPPMALQNLTHNSWPPRTFGNGFMNFGFLGILLFFAIQGWLTGFAYRLAARSHFHPVFVFLYLIFAFSFQVSNLKITELIIILIGLGLMFGPFVVAKNLLAGRRAGVGNARPY